MPNYHSFDDVEKAVHSGIIRNEPELRQAFVEALKNEISRICSSKSELVRYYMIPRLDETLKGRRPDIRLLNLVFEIEKPDGDLSRGRTQLHDYMKTLREISGGITIHGIVLNGIHAEHWVLNDNNLTRRQDGPMKDVVRRALHEFCSEKMPVVKEEDLADILGV